MVSKRGHHARLFLVFALLVSACSGGGLGAGCTGCLKPLPQPYDGPKTNNAVTAKISGDGFEFVNQNWQTLLTQFTTNPIDIPLACQIQTFNIPVIGSEDFAICDQNLNGSCDSSDVCHVSVQIDAFRIDPKNGGSQSNGLLTGSATVQVHTGDIHIRSVSDSLCFFVDDLECHANFDTTRSGAPNNTLTVDLTFSLDGRIDPQHPVLAFDVANLQGIDQLDSDDLSVGSDNTCSFGCDVLDVGFIKSFIIDQLRPTLEQKINDTIAQQRCRKCGAAGQQACPSPSTCNSDGVCDLNGSCIPLFLGVEGNISPGDTLGQYGVPHSASLDISAQAGGSVSSEQATGPHTGGLTLGVIGGAASRTGDAPSYKAPCVPDLPAPAGDAPPVPDFDTYGSGTDYHVGLGVSSYFLNQATYQAHRSGTMCIALSGEQIQLLNTGLFKTFLPSLGLVAGSDTQDAPMMVTLRPLSTPSIAIGAGTYDPQTQKPIDPLITVTMNNLLIDIYALVEDRWVRLFSLQVDVQLPLSLIVDGCPQGVTPALGDLKQLIAVSKPPFNSELLAEDPGVLAGLIPAVISLAQPALANALKPIAIPDFNGFGLHIDKLEGIGVLSGTEYDNLGLFGELRLAGQACDSATLRTTAELIGSRIPTLDELKPAPGKQLPWPVAVVRAGSTDPHAEAEYGYKVDDGLWSTFLKGPVLEITDPRFLIQGHHTIQVRARPAGGKGVADPSPVSIDFLVDYEGPEVRAVRHAAENTLEVSAKDNVSGPQRLEYRYQVGDEAFSAFGPKREVDLAAVDAAGRLTIEVRDEAGNVGRTVYRAPVAAPTAGLQPQPGSIEEANGTSLRGGCASADGLALFGLAPLALGLLRRRRPTGTLRRRS